MRGERYALRAGEYLVSRASRRLPAGIREERHQEWLAELPVILHDRTAGPEPRRVLRMLTFAADTLRGTTVAPNAYRHQGAHRRGDFENEHALAISLLIVFVILPGLLAWQAWLVYQLIFGASLFFTPGYTLGGLLSLIRRSASVNVRLFCAGVTAQGGGLAIRALASQCGWGHPLLFAIISYCGYAIALVLFGVALVRDLRSSSQHPVSDPTRQPGWDGPEVRDGG